MSAIPAEPKWEEVVFGLISRVVHTIGEIWEVQSLESKWAKFLRLFRYEFSLLNCYYRHKKFPASKSSRALPLEALWQGTTLINLMVVRVRLEISSRNIVWLEERLEELLAEAQRLLLSVTRYGKEDLQVSLAEFQINTYPSNYSLYGVAKLVEESLKLVSKMRSPAAARKNLFDLFRVLSDIEEILGELYELEQACHIPPVSLVPLSLQQDILGSEWAGGNHVPE